MTDVARGSLLLGSGPRTRRERSVAVGRRRRMHTTSCSPPCDTAELTAPIATRVIRDTLDCQVRAGHSPRR